MQQVSAETLIAVHRVTILGAGEDGCWLAARALAAGYIITLEDLMPARRRAAALRIADPRITYATSVEEAAREADLVIDFVPDELESKLEILSLLDRMAPPHTIFTTPTRTLSINDLASCTYRPERCLALRLPHPLGESPAFAVSVAHTPAALPHVIAAVVNFWGALGAQVGALLDEAALP